MRSSSRCLLPAALLALVLGTGTSRGAGTIDTTGATIAAGTALTAGTVRILPDGGPRSGPSVPAPALTGTIGTMAGSIPAFPGGGGGAAFTASADQTIAGGTYDFTTYTINANATVTYSGAVTIRATGDVTINGVLTTTAAGASIRILCGGTFSMLASPFGTIEGVLATGSAAPVEIDCNGSISTTSPDASRTQIRSFSGDVTLTSHTAAGSISLTNADVRSPAAVNVRAAGGVATSSVVLASDSGGTLVQAFGDKADFSNTTVVSFGSNVQIEGAKGVQVRASSDVDGSGNVTLRSFGSAAIANGAEDVLIDDSTVTNAGPGMKAPRLAPAPDIQLLSAAGVRLDHSALVSHTGVGRLVVTAYGGSVRMETPGSAQQSELSQLGTGDLLVSALLNVEVFGSSLVEVAAGSLGLQALNGFFGVAGDGTFLVEAGDGVVRCGDSVLVTSHPGTGVTKPEFTANSWDFAAGPAGIDLDVSKFASVTGATTLLSSGSVTLRGPCSAKGGLTVQTTAGGIDVAGATLSTSDVVSGNSAAIAVESFGGTTAIDASNATIRSGNALAGTSGNVTLAVYAAFPPVIDSYFLPKSVAVKLNKKDAAKSTLTATGSLDTGDSVAGLSGAATLTVGDLVTAAVLVADAKGRLSFKDANISLVVVPAKSGSSRAAFTLKRTGDLSALLDATGGGPLALRFQNQAIDAQGAVTLTKFKYTLGKARGALVSPNLFVYKAKATLKGGTSDSLSLAAGLATNGTTPQAAPDLTVGFGDTYSVTITSAQFGVAKKDAFTAKNPVPGVVLAKLDYAKETLTLTAKNVALGSFPAGAAIPVTVTLQLGTDLRRVELRMGVKKATISY